MSLRVSLVIVTLMSILAIGVAWVVENPPGGSSDPDLPFAYTIAPDDIRQIGIRVGEDQRTFLFEPVERVWYFQDPAGMPVSHTRFGGMTTLLSGPKVKRVLAEGVDNLAVYGLEEPSTVARLILRDGSQIAVELGDLTPDEESHYARMEGHSQVVLIDSSWGDVIKRLVSEPPFPKWRYTLNTDEVEEILFFDGNEVVRGISHREETGWVECDIPIGDDVPCTGSTPIDESEFLPYLDHLASPEFTGVEQIARTRDEVDAGEFGVTAEAPYLDIRITRETRPRVTEVDHVTMSLGNLTNGGEEMFVRTMEEPDVLRMDAGWGQKVLDLFTDRSFVADEQGASASGAGTTQ